MSILVGQIGPQAHCHRFVYSRPKAVMPNKYSHII